MYRVFHRPRTGPEKVAKSAKTHAPLTAQYQTVHPSTPRPERFTFSTYQVKSTQCSITCWHTPSFPGKASQETGTRTLAGPIQPAPKYVALTLIPRDELLPNTDITAGRLPKVSPPPRALRAIFDLGRTPTPTLSASSIHRHELSPAVLDECAKHNYCQELNTRKSHLAHTSSDPAPTTPKEMLRGTFVPDRQSSVPTDRVSIRAPPANAGRPSSDSLNTDKSKMQTERYTRHEKSQDRTPTAADELPTPTGRPARRAARCPPRPLPSSSHQLRAWGPESSAGAPWSG